MKRLLGLGLLLIVLCAPVFACAAVIWHSPEGNVQVHSVELQGEEWLFLPSGSNLKALQLEMAGETTTLDWSSLSSENETRKNVYSGLWNDTPLNVMVSQNLRSLHIQSSDPQNQGRLWLAESEYHERSTTAKLVILDKNGKSYYPMKIVELRGRGNSSWRGGYQYHDKVPYQIKLEDKTDLLHTGLRHEYSRTWVLLTNDDDPTLMRNQLGLDIAKELGMETASRCEQVDLYYDGEYCGTYLLAEKVEVGEHSVDIANFDRLLKPINELLRAPDPKLLVHPNYTGGHIPVDENEYGSYSYVEGVYDNRDVSAAGYLLELDGPSTMSEQTWFALPNERYISFKNPESAGPTMVQHVQQLFVKAYEAMLNYGYHPVTDEPLEELIDIESFTLSHLVPEIMHSSNAYFYSSTYFFIPQEETKIYAGPVWDFDHIAATPTPGLKDNNILSQRFYRTTVFQRAAKEIWANRAEPMFQTVLFGQTNGKYLKPFSEYQNELSMSWQMNYYRFYGDSLADEQFEINMDSLLSFLKEQSAFLTGEINAWGEDEPTHYAEILFELPYADPQNPTVCMLVDEKYGNLLLETEFTCIEPATEEEWGTWQVSFVLRPRPHGTIPEDIVVAINGTEYPVTVVDNTVTLAFEYVDWFYRPAIADGIDYGDVFDYDIYTDNHPELLEEGLSREEIIRHFRDNGMSDCEMANDYFDPMQVFDVVYEACEILGDNWPLYYETYLTDHLAWSEEMGFVYEPDWTLVE